MKAGMMYGVFGEAFGPAAPDAGVLLSEGGPGVGGPAVWIVGVGGLLPFVIFPEGVEMDPD